MRIYQPIPLRENSIISLDEGAVHHIARVMRAKVGEKVSVFNGEGGEYRGLIEHIDKKSVTVKLMQFFENPIESPLQLTLGLGISRGEKMDYTVQKSVELGVNTIVPLFTEFGNVKLDADRRLKKLQHWRAIVVNACEQCGRTKIPQVSEPLDVRLWVATVNARIKLVLAPTAEKKLSEIPQHSEAALLIGPEGGLSQSEIQFSATQGFLPLQLGPRILRTETAAVAAVVALQCYLGDYFR